MSSIRASSASNGGRSGECGSRIAHVTQEVIAARDGRKLVDEGRTVATAALGIDTLFLAQPLHLVPNEVVLQGEEPHKARA